MKIVGFRSREGKKESEKERKKDKRGKKWEALFGFQATVNAGCSESCRVGSWVPMFLPSSPHSLPEEFDPPDLSEYVWIYPPLRHTITAHCNRKPLWEQISLPPFFLPLYRWGIALATEYRVYYIWLCFVDLNVGSFGWNFMSSVSCCALAWLATCRK